MLDENKVAWHIIASSALKPDGFVSEWVELVVELNFELLFD